MARTVPKHVRQWTVKFPHADAVAVASAARRLGIPIAAYLRDAAIARTRAVEPVIQARPTRSSERLRATLRRTGLYDIP